MRILHIGPIGFQGYSGISMIVPKIIQYQNNNQNEADLLITNKIDDIVIQEARKKYSFKVMNYFDHSKVKIKNLILNYDILIFHSTYIPAHYTLSNIATKNKIPYILVPHGGMTTISHKKKYIKKLLGDYLFFNQIVKKAEKIQFLSQLEKNNSTIWNVNSYVVGNGKNIEKNILKDNRLNSNINFTLISRIDYYGKGFDLLLEAINHIKRKLTEHNVKFNIYGPDFDNSKFKINSYIKRKNLQNLVEVHDAVYGDDKVKILNDTDIFILTSRSEGQPMSVLEALSYRIPCILTPGTTLTDDVLKYDFGWSVSEDPLDIAKTILYAVENKDMIYEKGLRGVEYIEREHSWEKITYETLNEYKKVIKEYNKE